MVIPQRSRSHNRDDYDEYRHNYWDAYSDDDSDEDDSDSDSEPVPNTKTSMIINETIGMVNKLVQMGVSSYNILRLSFLGIRSCNNSFQWVYKGLQPSKSLSLLRFVNYFQHLWDALKLLIYSACSPFSNFSFTDKQKEILAKYCEESGSYGAQITFPFTWNSGILKLIANKLPKEEKIDDKNVHMYINILVNQGKTRLALRLAK